MKTVSDVLDIVHPKLAGTVFKHSYPDGHTQDEFTVINTVGVPADSIQTVQVNVNTYVKDHGRGIPNLKRMNQMAQAAITALKGFHDHTTGEVGQQVTDRVYIAFSNMAVLREEDMGMHFMNLRFKLTFLNN